jgi:hypothetical protein
MRVLVACEFSQVVCKAFRERGHEAYSCDIIDCSGGHPEWHIKDDVLNHLDDGWDLMIAHPPCTWLCQAMRTNAARKDRPSVSAIFETERDKAFEFVLALYNANIPRIAIENPIGYLNQAWRKPDQILRPYMFGHNYNKDICFWLKNLPYLNPTVALFPPKGGWKKLDFWSDKRNPDGKSLKSITFPGIAQAMAEQWG